MRKPYPRGFGSDGYPVNYRYRKLLPKGTLVRDADWIEFDLTENTRAALSEALIRYCVEHSLDCVEYCSGPAVYERVLLTGSDPNGPRALHVVHVDSTNLAVYWYRNIAHGGDPEWASCYQLVEDVRSGIERVKKAK